jgi:hypothetical protein
MRAEDHNPYVGPVVDLVNPYMTADANQTGGSSKAGGYEYAEWWLKRHPGRWALIGEGEVGFSKHIVQRLGLEYGVRNKRGTVGKVYARMPHPRGEELIEALRRTEPPEVLDLPELVRSPFNWTPEELAEAALIARANLFPVADRSRS